MNSRKITEKVYRDLYNEARCLSFDDFVRFAQYQMPEDKFFLTDGQIDVLEEIKCDLFLLTRIPFYRIVVNERMGDFSLLRGIVIYIAMSNTTASDSSIGLALGGRDRTTVQYWVKRIQGFIDMKDPCLKPYQSILDKKYDENAL